MQADNKQSKSSWGETALIVGLCQAGGFLSSYLGGAFEKHEWADDNAKPSIWPPQWVFPLVWIGNYTFLGLATGQVWRKRKDKDAKRALAWFGAHLLHNFLFIPLVYRVKRRSFYTAMDTVALVSGVLTTKHYSRISRSAMLLMLPYLAWLAFTTFIKFLWWRMESKIEE